METRRSCLLVTDKTAKRHLKIATVTGFDPSTGKRLAKTSVSFEIVLLLIFLIASLKKSNKKELIEKFICFPTFFFCLLIQKHPKGLLIKALNLITARLLFFFGWQPQVGEKRTARARPLTLPFHRLRCFCFSRFVYSVDFSLRWILELYYDKLFFVLQPHTNFSVRSRRLKFEEKIVCPTLTF